MSNRTKQVGAVLALMAMAFFAGLPLWRYINARAVSTALEQRTKAVVEKHPELHPAWDVAMQDEVLTFPEAKIIVESAGEKVDADE